MADRAKYSCILLIPKDAKLDLAAKWVEDAITAKWGAAALKERRKGKEQSIAERDEFDLYLKALDFLE